MAKSKKISDKENAQLKVGSEGEKIYLTTSFITTIGGTIAMITAAIFWALNSSYNTRERELAVDYKEKVMAIEDKYRNSINECQENVSYLKGRLSKSQLSKPQDSINNKSDEQK